MYYFLLVVFLRMFPSHGINIAGWQYKNLVFNLNEAGAMTYGVSVGGKPFITPSVMGLWRPWRAQSLQDFQIENTEFTTKDETWTQPWGENKSIRNHYNEMAVRLKDPANTRLTLRFRVFDDGLAFVMNIKYPKWTVCSWWTSSLHSIWRRMASHGLFPPVLKPTSCCIVPCPSARWIMPTPRWLSKQITGYMPVSTKAALTDFPRNDFEAYRRLSLQIGTGFLARWGESPFCRRDFRDSVAQYSV